jgi:hypothetical protein
MDRASTERITVSLARGQKDALEEIAEVNRTTVAFVVRYIVARYLEDQNRGQLELSFPKRD